MTNYQAAQKVFDTMKEYKFFPVKIKCITKNNYSEFYFDIKGLCGWQFGMWVCTDEQILKKYKDKNEDEEYPIVSFFCKHKFNEYIKFNPAYNFFVSKLYSFDFKQSSNKMWIWRIIDILDMIKRHPFISFAMDEFEDKYYNRSYILNFVTELLRKIENFWEKYI